LRILISGGGTGGHIYPALAVAHALRERYGAELLFIGDVNGLETEIVPKVGIPFAGISAGKLRRYLSRGTFTDLGRIPVGMAQALSHVRRFRPDAAFTSGGYVAVPAGLAARAQGVPLVMHQQDVSPNLANRLLTPVAMRISVSFEESLRYFPSSRTSLAGNPVREDILALAGRASAEIKPLFGFDPTLPVLLVTGGSQGARHLNEVVAEALPELLPHCQVLHVSGALTADATRAAAEARLAELPDPLRRRYQLYAYLHDTMAQALAASDIVFCRSGAATLAELAELGRASLLVPLPPGFGGSPQAINAEVFRRAGAAEVLQDRDLSVASLLEALLPLLEDDALRIAMGTAAQTFAHPEAADALAASVAELAERRAQRRLATSRA
jgi:UDP-N-acetylglucosamine--N-acetylmuramyl-(pentapeptide) pyrophosphoryl-undecaprenol N-acetylglucosamine transferase